MMAIQFWASVLVTMLLFNVFSGQSPLIPEAQSSIAAAPSTELRGVWLTNIDSEVLFSRRNLRQGLRRLHRLNFNTIYPTVWNWGYTLYPSAVAERVTGVKLDPQPGLQRRDMLAEAVDQGHRLGMSVIPWFEFGLMAPAESELVRRHPNWVTRRRDGTSLVMEGTHPRVWLNPAHPEVQQFMLDLIGEIVANYEVDGLQLDDHFGMPAELGYDSYTVRLYQREHNGQLPPNDPNDAEWKQWRANQISKLMQRVFRVVKTRKPNAIVALSPNPREFAFDSHLQDWGAWERQGLIEELIVQVYRNDLDRFISELERPELGLAKTHIPVGIGILAGLKNRITDINQIAQQIDAVRDRRFAGVSFFFYETIGDRDRHFQAFFPTPARRPQL